MLAPFVLRKVVTVVRLPGRAGGVRLVLECDHEVVAPRELRCVACYACAKREDG